MLEHLRLDFTVLEAMTKIACVNPSVGSAVVDRCAARRVQENCALRHVH